MLSRLAVAIAAVSIAFLAGQAPALAQADDAKLLQEMRGFGDITSGQLIGDGKRADKVLMFGRNAQGHIIVTEIQALALGGDWVEPKEGAIAIMRTRASTAHHNEAPDPADMDYVRRTGARVFIVGEWSKPPMIWEIAREDGQVRWRSIDSAAQAGPWRAVPATGS
jgi:hypothetical protein